ncbi:1-aminocyclopropane-1-carboxylate deaminase-related [Anaeramoeba flamelloides]|uniref:1-aminocyclopropane-1-carboxylate deaminase-related n=1 Tax=Anaeramoeba flamelloides TaxID=1746091 RepID=A0AAV7Y859_9EUKA|nr:1-aminocyclopropane-1-carboxylate deaminase-related [Anaeramoeba flamelloides]|eukprot:Anaeramoba_flamelloidesa86931_259.p1 GENE.a86931_259~~a86931_259.p1  ORF type:complete len:321 (-),score=70.90 a86931_259:317-1279(-)
MNLKPEKLSLATFPTPIHHCSNGVDIKLDSMSGCEMSGNKIRKLEFLLQDALNKKSTIILTTGGSGSNHCRATAVAAKRLGLKSLLLLRSTESESKKIDGNLFISTLVGAKIEFITRKEYQIRNELLAKRAKELEQEGEVPYIIPEGGSNALGSWGYSSCFEEILKQRENLQMYNKIIVPTGSVGTVAGLVVGVNLSGTKNCEIIGVPVCNNSEYFSKRLENVIQDFNQLYGTEVNTKCARFVDGYIGEGYSVPYQPAMEQIKILAQTEGIILDHCYTGKAWNALVSLIEKGELDPQSDKILFIHTGGIFSVFPYKDLYL